MVQFIYPVAVTGYVWNMMQKISLALNIPRNEIQVVVGGSNTTVGFTVDITESQKQLLDTIMNSADPCLPDIATGVTYRIADLWGMRQWFASQFGMEPIYWFDKEKPDGSGECYIYLNFPRQLTATEKKRILDTYQMTIGEIAK